MHDSPQRHDLYAFIHKGLRAFMTHALLRVGRLDPQDAAELAEVGEELHALLDICSSHLHHEGSVVHAAMEARQPGSTARVEAEHREHEQSIGALRAMIHLLRGQPQAVHALYHALSEFVAHNFEHMLQEETAHNAVLWATHSDAELRALEQRIQQQVQPQQMQLAMRWMLPHMAPAERAAMLQGMRQSAPSEVFNGVLGLVRPLLGGRDWLKLSQALGV